MYISKEDGYFLFSHSIKRDWLSDVIEKTETVMSAVYSAGFSISNFTVVALSFQSLDAQLEKQIQCSSNKSLLEVASIK